MVTEAIANLGVGEEPSEDVLKGCEQYLCSLLCPKGQNIVQATPKPQNPMETYIMKERVRIGLLRYAGLCRIRRLTTQMLAPHTF